MKEKLFSNREKFILQILTRDEITSCYSELINKNIINFIAVKKYKKNEVIDKNNYL